jgi:2-dehydropantoate 2-reductase
VKYAVIGTGAIGGYYGGKLAHAGNDVHFLFHSDYTHVKEHGFRVDSIGGDFIVPGTNAYGAAADMPKCDVVLVGLKTTNNGILKDILQHIVHKDSIVILIQNGLGVEDDLARDMPGLQTAGGLAFICSNRIGAGHIHHLDQGRINIGAYGDASRDVLKRVCDDFTSAGVESHLAEDLMFARWQKLVWNIPFNGLTVVLGSETDRIMKNESALALVREMMNEVVDGANACGVPLKREFIDAMIETTMKMPPYSPSMKLDWDNRRPMEIEYIYTRPVAAALAHGFDMRKISMLERQLRFLEKTRV